MTLSRDLKTLSHWFAEVAEGRAEFTAEGARAFQTSLDRCAWNAQAIEEAAVSDPDILMPHLKAVGESDTPAQPRFRRGSNVVSLCDKRRAPLQRPIGDGIDGGDAA
jgi:hypothetical protein